MPPTTRYLSDEKNPVVYLILTKMSMPDRERQYVVKIQEYFLPNISQKDNKKALSYDSGNL